MEEYKKPYITLFRAVSFALQELEQQNYGRVREMLIQGQQEAEEAFISFEADTEREIIRIIKNEP